MKKCPRCKETKQFSEFRRDKNRKDGRQLYCTICDKEYQKEWYSNNKVKVISKNKKRRKIIKEEIQAFMLQYLEDKACIMCGESDILVLEFDHLEDKNFAISQYSDKGLQKVKSEILKCQILCANCHRRKTQKEFNSYKWRYSQEKRQGSAKASPQV